MELWFTIDSAFCLSVDFKTFSLSGLHDLQPLSSASLLSNLLTGVTVHQVQVRQSRCDEPEA